MTTPPTFSSNNNNNISASAREALDHLKRLKPLDGWAVEVHPTLSSSSSVAAASAAAVAAGNKTGVVRLLRRNVPLTDSYFFDIHYDPATSCVVGILTSSSHDVINNKNHQNKAQAQVLVDAKGSPLSNRQVQLVTVTTWNPNQPRSATRSATTTTSSSSTTRATTRATTTASFENNSSSAFTSAAALRDEENMKLLNFIWRHGVLLIGCLWVAKLVFKAVFLIYVVAIPILYLYMIQTCPAESTFEAKKEIKRVLRGYHLPEDHPDKPKGFWHETFARVTASVVTELSTGFGYEVAMTNFAGAAIFVSVQVPAAKMNLYWIGAFGQWRYIWSRQMESTKMD